MWLFTKVGFYSVVEADGGRHLMVRARVREDLDALRKTYFQDLGPTYRNEGTDYPYRAFTTRRALARCLSKVALDLKYRNFKDEVTRTQGRARHDLYARVWSVMYGAEEKLAAANDGCDEHGRFVERCSRCIRRRRERLA